MSDADAPKDIEDVHDALILVLSVTAKHHRQFGISRLELAQLALELIERDRHGVEFDVAGRVDGDGLSLGFLHLGGGLVTRARQVHLHSLDTRSRHDDEDQKENQVEVHHRGDVDVVEAFFVGRGHGCELLVRCDSIPLELVAVRRCVGFLRGAVELGHFCDELIDEDLHQPEGVFDATVQVAVDEERGDRDDQTDHGRKKG